MIGVGVLSTVTVLVLLAPAPAKKQSADVVQVTLEPGSIADGQETYFVSLKVAKGWHVYANSVGAKAAAGSATAVEFLIDGEPEGTDNVYYPKGVARKGASGTEYRAYGGTVFFTGWLSYADTKDAHVVSVRVKVVATDGKTRLKASVVTAEVRWRDNQK
jgi:hypothetical protein